MREGCQMLGEGRIIAKHIFWKFVQIYFDNIFYVILNFAQKRHLYHF